MGNVCPACNSTDIAETTQNHDGKNTECLDCFFRWTAGGRSKRSPGHYARNRNNRGDPK